MKRLFISIAFLISPLFAMAATQISVNLGVGEPNYYGSVPINGLHPQLVYSNPAIAHHRNVVYPPVYLRVPAAYHSRWGYYCGRYNACNRPVYFINDDWYRNTYVDWHHRHKHRGRDEHQGGHHHGRHDNRSGSQYDGHSRDGYHR